MVEMVLECLKQSNGIRGIFAGGYDDASPNVGLKDICYITMATTGNATEFGDLIGKDRDKTV